MTDTVTAQLVALKTAPVVQLKQQWRDLFESEPPPYNRRFLESRLAYRIQELAYGGLKPETVAKLEALGEELYGKGRGNPMLRRIRHQDKPVTGTRLIREWQGVEHCVTVLDDGYEYGGRPFKSLSHVARTITGTQWNGWTFFGLKNQKKGTRAPERAVRATPPPARQGLADDDQGQAGSGQSGRTASTTSQRPGPNRRAKSGAVR